MKTDICAQVECFFAAKKFGRAKRQLLTRKKKSTPVRHTDRNNIINEANKGAEKLLLRWHIKTNNSEWYASTSPPIRRYLVRLLSRNKACIDYGRGECLQNWNILLDENRMPSIIFLFVCLLEYVSCKSISACQISCHPSAPSATSLHCRISMAFN